MKRGPTGVPTIAELADATAGFWYATDEDEVFIAVGDSGNPRVARIKLGKVFSRRTNNVHDVYAHLYEGWGQDLFGLSVLGGATALFHGVKGVISVPENCP